MSPSAWLRILFHPVMLWMIAQGVALYAYLHFTPLPRSAIERWMLSIQTALHKSVLWLTAPWEALRRAKELETFASQLQERLSALSSSGEVSPAPVGAIGNFSVLQGYKFLPAEVVYRSFLLRENYAILDKGGRDGVFPGLGVISPQGVIGIIAETTATTSIMYGIFHKDVHLSALLPQHEVIGITKWDIPILNRLSLEYVPLYVPVEAGEEVWTAPGSMIFPAGLRIGRLREVRGDFSRGFHAIEIETYAEWSRLSSVFILIPQR
ncbi:MAG: rod shape-determining protein MreC [Bacteroidia bacterium]|nr:rod shape-determining protein MreC [Bacteroidia bacterium]MCX7763963.1 rod shape-determining protein MreC [Bacteroidia bacterium]MDW8057976.1 rod shape-determining protein MreC [Bacteroidia bacterium]